MNLYMLFINGKYYKSYDTLNKLKNAVHAQNRPSRVLTVRIVEIPPDGGNIDPATLMGGMCPFCRCYPNKGENWDDHGYWHDGSCHLYGRKGY